MNQSSSAIVVLVATFLSPQLSTVNALQPIFVLTASDAQAQDSFGFDVATDSNTIIVGNRDFGAPGAAYLFNAHTGAQIAKLLPSNGSINQQFGTSVAVDGTKAVVGSWNGAYVYDFSDLGHIVETKLIPTGGLVGQFGIDVDISGNTVIVGANGENHLGDYTGAAYLFDADSGVQLKKLTAGDAQAGDNFGISVAIDGGIAAVGSPLAHIGSGQNGAVYEFDASRTVTIGQQLAKYVDPMPPVQPDFGYSLDMIANHIITGEAFGSTFLWDSGTIPGALPLSSGEHEVGDFVSVDYERSVVGHLHADRVDVYNTPDRQFRFSLFGPAINQAEDFGISVATSHGLIVVGADNTNGKGAAYVYFVPEPASGGLVLFAIMYLASSARRRETRAFRI